METETYPEALRRFADLLDADFRGNLAGVWAELEMLTNELALRLKEQE